MSAASRRRRRAWRREHMPEVLAARDAVARLRAASRGDVAPDTLVLVFDVDGTRRHVALPPGRDVASLTARELVDAINASCGGHYASVAPGGAGVTLSSGPFSVGTLQPSVRVGSTRELAELFGAPRSRPGKRAPRPERPRTSRRRAARLGLS